jgi:ParB family chromosome partitioning protein
MSPDTRDEPPKRKGLARGLSALIGDDPIVAMAKAEKRGPEMLAIAEIAPSPFQPRRRFDDPAIEDLAQSIRENGILQPILVRVRKGADPAFEIVAGERRWRAAQRAQLHQVPVIVTEIDDRTALEIALVENIQRQDLTPIEEARGYQRLQGEFAYTQEQLAERIGRSRPDIANRLRLLSLPPAVQAMIEDGRLSAGHGRALVGTPDPEAMAREVIGRGLNVRATEAMVAALGKPRAGGHGKPAAMDADTAALARRLADRIGVKVEIRDDAGKGEVRLRYRSLDEFDRLCRAILGPDALG